MSLKTLPTLTGTPLDYVPLDRATADPTDEGCALKTTPAVRISGYVIWAAAIIFVAFLICAAP